MKIIWFIFAIAIIIIDVGIAEWSNLVEKSQKSQKINYILEKYINRNNTAERYATNCSTTNGIQTIQLVGLEPFEVLCNSSWMMILNRFDGHLNFYRDWQTYKTGFGNLSSEFFIGLEKLHAITASQEHEVYIRLEDFDGSTRYALYDDFLVGNETGFYAMEKLGHYAGDAGDSLSYHLHMKFSTYDKDNDRYSGNCAIERMGAWWYNWCNNRYI